MAENLKYKTYVGSWCNGNYCRLYNWETAIKVCPDGWRLPTKKDFTVLLNNIGISGENVYFQLRSPNGFNATLGGAYTSWSGFTYIGEAGYYWTSNKGEGNNLFIDGNNKTVSFGDTSEELGLSVRCIKD
jgi:uncharacterized protein (TIGR02145 family)